MSEAKNFRIGNLILLNGAIITVSGIDQYGINPEVNRGVESYDYYFDNTDNDKLEGIALTEDMLSDNDFWYDDINGSSGFWTKGDFRILHGEDGFCYDYKTTITFVHHLQDLYQAIKLEELPFKLESNG